MVMTAVGQEMAYTGEAITSTTKKTNWGVNVWRQWAAKNGETRPLETVSFPQLNKLLCRFYAEICKVSGEPYEAECLRLMRKSIERYLQENTIGEVSLKRDPTFRESNLVLKQRMRALMLRGNRKQQLVQININAKEEDLLWKSGQLGHLTALALLNVNLLNLVKRMGIKGRKDLYMLRVEDFETREGEQGLFHVMCTKPSAGGTENVRSMVSCPGEGERCPVFLFREFLRHRPKHMRGLGPLFLALSNFTTDADVWYRPVRLSEATLGSIVRQMANAARTMGLGQVETPNYKIDIKPKVERMAVAPNINTTQMQTGGGGGQPGEMHFDENDYLSSADASILAQYYGDKGYPPTMVRSNKVDVKLNDALLQNLASSISSSLNGAPGAELNLAAVATSLANLQSSHLVQQPISTATPLFSAPTAQLLHSSSPIQGPCIPGLSLIKAPDQHGALPQIMIAQPVISSPATSRPTLIPNVVIQSPVQSPGSTHPFQPVPQSPQQQLQQQQTLRKSPPPTSSPNVGSTAPSLEPVQGSGGQVRDYPTKTVSEYNSQSNPLPDSSEQASCNDDSVIQDCTINITSGSDSSSLKQERMEYTDFVSKTMIQDSKIIHTEIRDIMCVLKQGSARFVNCTFNFNFPSS